MNNPNPEWLKMDMICRESWDPASGVGTSGLQGLLINRIDIAVEILMICPSALTSWTSHDQLGANRQTQFGENARDLDYYGSYSYGRLLFHELTHSINAMGTDRGASMRLHLPSYYSHGQLTSPTSN